MAILQIQTPKGTRVLELPEGRVTIGRKVDNDIVIEDERASRCHCTLDPQSGGYLLSDQGSRNGTQFKGKLIDKAIVLFGESFCVGQTIMRLFDESLPPVEQVDTANANPETKADALVEDTRVTDALSAGAPVAEVFDEDDLPLNAPSAVSAAEEIIKKARSDLNTLRTSGTDPGFAIKNIALLDCHGSPVHTENNAPEASDAVRTLRLLFYGAFRTRATDMHFDPVREGHQIRFRVDGKMLPVVLLPEVVSRSVLAVVKVLAELDIAGRKDIQDGSFSLSVPRHIDCRISLTPTSHGEKLVARILDTAVIPSSIGQLGLPRNCLKQVRSLCHLDAGMMIVSGPTGSGKTTTLYTAIRSLDTGSRNVVTIEDPIEYHLDGVTQIQTDSKQGLTFGHILKSVLRQDPDVILVGEMRDLETAQTAMQAAMTGHLVFTTLHARDTIGSMFRLLDLGVEAYMIANSVSMCLAQRLIRVLCPHCKKAYRPKPSQLIKMKMENEGVNKLYMNVGCRRCMGVGFWGRMAIFELLNFNDDLRDALMTTKTIHDIRKAAGEWAFQTLRDSGYKKAADGVTTLEEVDRVAMRD